MKNWKWSDKKKIVKVAEALAKLPVESAVEPSDRPQPVKKVDNTIKKHMLKTTKKNIKECEQRLVRLKRLQAELEMEIAGVFKKKKTRLSRRK